MRNSQKPHFITMVARKCGVSPHTIRYYEKVGLLDRPRRSPSRYRLYSDETIEKIRFIKKAQALGLSLSEIKKIMVCSRDGLQPCCNLVRGLFTKKIKEFELKIRELESMKKTLEMLLSEWIPSREARKKKYAVCPQIDREPNRKGGSS